MTRPPSTNRNSSEAEKDTQTCDLLMHLISAMSRLHQANGQAAVKNRYYYARGTDGCDDTFDIYRQGDNRLLISFHFWDAEAHAEANARRVTALLNVCDGISTEQLGLALAKWGSITQFERRK